MNDPVTCANAIRLHDVSLRLGERWALARLDLEVEAGSSLLLMGDNGAGKTTLLKVMATLLQPTAGRLELFGALVTRGTAAEVRARVGLMSHATHLYDAQTGRESLRFAAAAMGRARAPRIEALLDWVGLTAHAERPVRTYSAGMKRRLMMARLMLKQPTIALLDEPWSELDSEATALLDAMVRDLHNAGATVIIATHDVEHARSLCQASVRLQRGRRVDA